MLELVYENEGAPCRTPARDQLTPGRASDINIFRVAVERIDLVEVMG